MEEEKTRNYSLKRLSTCLLIFSILVAFFVGLLLLDKKTGFLGNLSSRWFGKYLEE